MVAQYGPTKALDDRVKAAEQTVAEVDSIVTITTHVVPVAATHKRKVILSTGGSATNCTINQDSANLNWAIGDWFEVLTPGAGAVTFVAGSGATINKLAASSLVAARYSRIRATKTAANTWMLTASNGGLVAS